MNMSNMSNMMYDVIDEDEDEHESVGKFNEHENNKKKKEHNFPWKISPSKR